jgi:hypothetical protein
MKKHIAFMLAAALITITAFAQGNITTIQYQNSCGIVSGGGCSSPASACTGIDGSIFLLWAWPWGYSGFAVTGVCTDCGSAYSELVGGCCCS